MRLVDDHFPSVIKGDFGRETLEDGHTHSSDLISNVSYFTLCPHSSFCTQVVGCHMGQRGVDKPVVRYASGEVAQGAYQALRSRTVQSAAFGSFGCHLSINGPLARWAYDGKSMKILFNMDDLGVLPFQETSVEVQERRNCAGWHDPGGRLEARSWQASCRSIRCGASNRYFVPRPPPEPMKPRENVMEMRLGSIGKHFDGIESTQFVTNTNQLNELKKRKYMPWSKDKPRLSHRHLACKRLVRRSEDQLASSECIEANCRL